MAGQNISLNYWNRVKSIAKYAVVYNLSIMIFAEAGIGMGWAQASFSAVLLPTAIINLANGTKKCFSLTEDTL